MAAAAGHVPGAGFGSFVIVAIVVAFLVSMIRNLRSHTAEEDDAADTATASGSTPATATVARETARTRAARRARQSFRRFRKHGWLRRKLPGDHGDPTPAAAAADGAAALMAVFAYASGFAAGLAHAKTRTTPTAPSASGTAKPTTASGPTRPTPAAGAPKPTGAKARLADLFGRLRRQPPEGEVVDPEPPMAIANARDTDVVDAEIVADTDDQPEAPEPSQPSTKPDTETQPQGAPPMAFIQTIHDLIAWAKRANAAAETQAAEAEMRAKVANGRAEDAAAAAQSASDHAATLGQLYAFWSTQNMDPASLMSIEIALADARAVQGAESHRAECEAATAQANVRSVVAIHLYQESLGTMAATVKARQMQHAEAQRDTGNAAAAAVVLEGA